MEAMSTATMVLVSITNIGILEMISEEVVEVKAGEVKAEGARDVEGMGIMVRFLT